MTAGERWRVVVRADASRTIGTGHVRRMSVLAQALRREGALVDLLCNPEAPDLCPEAVTRFDGWRAVTAETDGPALAAAHGVPPAWVVFDHYGLGAREETPYRTVAARLASLDDLADRPHDVDLLVDMNLGRSPSDYDGLTPPGCAVHTGAEWQIVHEAFLRMRPESLARRVAAPPPKMLLLGLGGVDPGGATEPLLRALRAEVPALALEVAMGAGPTVERVRAAAEGTTVHVDTAEMPALMTRADVAVGAGGTMTWERNCLGLPSVLLVMADNQVDVGAAMARAGAAVVFDARSTVPVQAVARAVSELTADPSVLAAMSRRCAALGGGDGAARFAARLNERRGGGRT